MIYSDASIVSKVGGKSVHGVYIYLGNHKINYRRKISNNASIMLAYLPKLPSREVLGINTKDYALANRILFMKAMKILLEPLEQVGKR
jgi:hypothetical protein